MTDTPRVYSSRHVPVTVMSTPAIERLRAMYRDWVQMHKAATGYREHLERTSTKQVGGTTIRNIRDIRLITAVRKTEDAAHEGVTATWQAIADEAGVSLSDVAELGILTFGDDDVIGHWTDADGGQDAGKGEDKA